MLTVIAYKTVFWYGLLNQPEGEKENPKEFF